VLEARVPGTDTTVTQHPGDELGKGANVKSDDEGETSGGRVIAEVQERKDKEKEGIKTEAVQQAQKFVVDCVFLYYNPLTLA
jgi:hypothetical protein